MFIKEGLQWNFFIRRGPSKGTYKSYESRDDLNLDVVNEYKTIFNEIREARTLNMNN